MLLTKTTLADGPGLPLGVGHSGPMSIDVHERPAWVVSGPEPMRITALRTLAAGALIRGHRLMIHDRLQLTPLSHLIEGLEPATTLVINHADWVFAEPSTLDLVEHFARLARSRRMTIIVGVKCAPTELSSMWNVIHVHEDDTATFDDYRVALYTVPSNETIYDWLD